MKVGLSMEVPLEEDLIGPVLEALRLEALSAPPGGRVEVSRMEGGMLMRMTAEDVSRARAMLNSYTGLLKAALGAVHR